MIKVTETESISKKSYIATEIPSQFLKSNVAKKKVKL